MTAPLTVPGCSVQPHQLAHGLPREAPNPSSRCRHRREAGRSLIHPLAAPAALETLMVRENTVNGAAGALRGRCPPRAGPRGPQSPLPYSQQE